jgi:hypothetical protein
LRRRTRELEKVAAHFRRSGTHLGEWKGRPPSGRRFQDVDEMYVFRVRNGKLTDATGVETTSAGCGNPASTADVEGNSRTIKRLIVTIGSQSEARSYDNCGARVKTVPPEASIWQFSNQKPI